MKTKLERALAKHADLVKLIERQRRDYDKHGAAMARALGRLTKTQRALARSQKRVDQERLLAVSYNAGPTASPVPALVEQVVAKPVEPVLDDDMPKFLKRDQVDETDQQREIAAKAALADKAERDKFNAEQAEAKKQRAQSRQAKRNAIARGDTKKMPLSGRAAMEYIRNKKAAGSEPTA